MFRYKNSFFRIIFIRRKRNLLSDLAESSVSYWIFLDIKYISYILDLIYLNQLVFFFYYYLGYLVF